MAAAIFREGGPGKKSEEQEDGGGRSVDDQNADTLEQIEKNKQKANGGAEHNQQTKGPDLDEETEDLDDEESEDD